MARAMMNGVERPTREETVTGQPERWRLGGMAGRSTAMERLFLQMRYLASHLRIALIEGERGTGKRLAAETLHSLGPLHGMPFVAAQAPEFLAADQMRQQLAAAAGGTLYLASVERLPATAQLRLLHLIEWMRGSSRAPSAEFAGLTAPRMLLTSCERPLRPLTLYGRFRADLQQQLALVRLCLPPLRDRREDVPLLAEQFGRAAALENGRPWNGFSRQALALLAEHPWPGNVAELRTSVRAAAARGTVYPLTAEDIAPGMAPGMAPGTVPGTAPETAPTSALAPACQTEPAGPPERHTRLHLAPVPAVPATAMPAHRRPSPAVPVLARREPSTAPDQNRDLDLDRVILTHIRWVLALVDGNKLRASRLLGISRSTLYRLLEGEAKTAAAHTA